jgi:multicomponent Na+:H+ antiporter subunit C
MDIARVVEISSVLVFFIGFYGLITSRNIIKSIAAITVMQMAVIVFFLGVGFIEGMRPPIGTSMENVADPLPQALVLTAIIIGVTVTAVNLTMLISLSHQIKNTNWDSVESDSSRGRME